ncbi:MAG TPA: hypothetical protein PKU89_11180 [Kiritimatiellia bacterium]|jgi:hypothetical protein|nr:hypothetical protein [Kiritimatiellia bacterium]
MMNLRKLWLAALALCVTAGVVSADPIRTLFTKENKFPGAMGWELFLAGGGSSLDDDSVAEDADTYFVAPGARFGLTDRVAIWAAAPFAGFSAGDLDEQGLGDAQAGLEFLFFEDIFEYAWIVPHVTGIFPTGDEDDGLGTGEMQGRVGISIGTTVNDVVHFALDVSYTSNGAAPEDEFSDDRDELLAGALSIVWDLDERASLIGEVQLRDDPINDQEDDYAFRGHAGLAYKVNRNVSVMLYGGGASGLAQDVYGQGRLVYSF